ncbi:MAG: HupE/UreJ family protein [Opitutaceae bacterium]|nr:HupE/UreJ family protein [Opitutaceae bacterium]
MKLRTLTLSLAAAVTPSLALAHPGHDGGHDFGWDFTGGFTHPLLGWDHLLAMLAVGLWAARIAGKARLVLPLAFVCTLALGAVAARAGFPTFGSEQAIAGSLILLGLALAVSPRISLPTAAAATTAFAFAHGVAHGAEVPAGTNFGVYVSGFVLASALLHIAGLFSGAFLAHGARARQAIGGAVALAGAVALFA